MAGSAWCNPEIVGFNVSRRPNEKTLANKFELFDSTYLMRLELKIQGDLNFVLNYRKELEIS
jgi:hypothetical protein